MPSLIKPHTPKYDASLLAQVENKRWHCANFSDAHWLMQLIVEYVTVFRANKDGKWPNPWAKMSAAALTDVFETFVRSGEKAAINRAQALKDDGFPILAWFPAPMSGDNWNTVRQHALKHGFYRHDIDGD